MDSDSSDDNDSHVASDSNDEKNLVLAAGDVIKAVEKLVPSGDGNSFSEWLDSNEIND